MSNLSIFTSEDEFVSLIHTIFQIGQATAKSNSEQHEMVSNTLSAYPKLLTIKETCKILGVTRITLNTWKKRGRIPYYKIGGKVYFKEDEVQNALRSFDFSKLNNF